MENIMTVPFQTWLGRTLRSTPADNYVRKPTPPKLAKCRYERVKAINPQAARPLQHKHTKAIKRWIAKVRLEDSIVRDLAVSTAGTESTEAWFNRLADEWEQEVSNISSLTAMVAHPKYREIVDMKWRVVPFLISDLQRHRRFWLPALEEITEIQPFDPGDSGNTKRMIDDWVRWGKQKYKNQI